MFKSTFAGHPLHPQLVVIPSALLPFSFVLDVMHSATGDESYADAAYYSMVGGYLGGAAAAAAGAADYFAIPSETQTKRLANVHAAMNVGLLGLYSVNLLMRRGSKPRTNGTTKLMSALGTVGLLASAWYGAHLVYEYGVRVKGASPIAHVPDAKVPGDEKIAAALERAASVTAPDEGPGA
jgi:uncharacterized membrane protein